MPNDDVSGLQFGMPDKPTLETLRHDASKLRDIAPTDDVTRHAAFAPAAKVDLGEAARLKPEPGAGLRIGGDLDRLDAGLDKLGELATNARVERLLTQARQKIEQEKYHIAINLIEQALQIDAAAAAAVGLKAICVCAIGEFERALDLLDKARQLVTDAETGLVVSTMRAKCEQVITDAVCAEAADMINAGALADALAVLERYVRRLPDSLPLRYVHAGLLMMLDRLADARTGLDVALRTATGENAEVFRDMRERIQRMLHQPQIDAARERLRARDPKGAIRHLEQCPADMRESGDVGLLWNYAHERYADRALLSFVGRKRLSQAGAAPLDPQALEALLIWLFSEELEAGRAAVNESRYHDACARYATAERIDDRCYTVAYWYAVAGLLLCRSPDTALAECEALLLDAGARAEVAAQDPELRESAAKIAMTIEDDLADVRLLTRIDNLVRRFNAEITNLSRRRVRDYYEVRAIRSRFQRIRTEAATLRRDCDGGSRETRCLDGLIEAVGKVLS